jgi:hypothetical protein
MKVPCKFVNKVEILQLFHHRPLESEGDFLYNATIRDVPEEVETQRED